MCRPEIPGKKTNGVLEKTALGIVSVVKESVSNEECAGRSGLLQSCDPRMKTLAIGLMILASVGTHNPFVLLALYAVCIAMALRSNLNLGFFLGRTMPFIPLFTLFIAIPALFSGVTPGKALYTFPLVNLTITEPGLDGAIQFCLRVLDSVSFAVLLVLTTRHHVLLKVLRIFKVPQIFVMTIGMCYRYIFLFLEIIQNTFTAVKSRVGYVTDAGTGRGLVASNMAGLWLRSYRMHSQVYDAMIARGYTGEPKVIDEFKTRLRDVAILASSFSMLIGVICLNLFSR